jgi:hypothetical protein
MARVLPTNSVFVLHHATSAKEEVMADYRERAADPPAINAESSLAMSGPDWETEDAYWQSAYPARPYARADRSYEYYRVAYRYGAEHAAAWRDREFTNAEHDLRTEWAATQTGEGSWEEMKVAVRDAWDHIRGRTRDDRTHIR